MTVFSPDDRSLVQNTAAGINAAVVHITVQFRDGMTAMASGALLDATHVLTAGHVVYDRADGGWVASASVTPGEQGTNAPVGAYQAKAAATTPVWILTQNPGSDYAVITLAKPVTGVATFFHLDAMTSQALLGATLSTAGYPGDKGSAFPTSDQYQESGRLTQVTTTLELTQMDVFAGQSGSPVWVQDAQGNYDIVGIVDFETSSVNGFVRVTGQLESMVESADPAVVAQDDTGLGTIGQPGHHHSRFPFA